MDRPRVRGTVGILILRGLLTLFQAFTAMDVVNRVGNSSLPSWYTPLLYFLIALGVLSVVGAVLIAMYKRLGLYLGGAAIVLDLATFALLLVGGQFAPGAVPIVGILIDLLILYYVYKYLTQEPEKLAFN